MSIQVYAEQKNGSQFTKIKISYTVEGVLNTLVLENDDAQHLFEVLTGRQDVMFVNKNDDTPRYSYTEVVYASKNKIESK
jgi:dTDP-4-dehydrorhamnose 3,5-epimerase-like enzyme